jgi:hypothetical protein
LLSEPNIDFREPTKYVAIRMKLSDVLASHSLEAGSELELFVQQASHQIAFKELQGTLGPNLELALFTGSNFEGHSYRALRDVYSKRTLEFPDTYIVLRMVGFLPRSCENKPLAPADGIDLGWTCMIYRQNKQRKTFQKVEPQTYQAHSAFQQTWRDDWLETWTAVHQAGEKKGNVGLDDFEDLLRVV